MFYIQTKNQIFEFKPKIQIGNIIDFEIAKTLTYANNSLDKLINFDLIIQEAYIIASEALSKRLAIETGKHINNGFKPELALELALNSSEIQRRAKNRIISKSNGKINVQ